MSVYLPTEQKYLDKLEKIVEANFSNEKFGVTELADEIGLSHSSLHRKLKAITNKSASQFIRETRLKYAMKLLQLQAGTVAEVAYGVGFGSTTYFSKCFHDYYGYPPGEVKKRYIPDQDSGEVAQSIEEKENKIKSIAVLPFDNYTGDNSQDFLVFGLHDALISELGQLGAIRVISKTSVLKYLNSKKTIKEIASELGVDAIIEASVLTIGEKIRIQLKLFNALPNEQQLWAQSFDVEMSDVLKLFSKVIKNVANEIKLSLSPEQQTQLDETREINPECYKAFLRGKYNLYQLTPEGIKKGLEYLHEAVRIDPAEPFAHAGLALGYLEIAHSPFATDDAYIKAESAALQAAKLDSSMAEVHLALGEVCIYSSWKFDEGERHYKNALKINPNLSLAHYHYSWALFLFGRMEEAVHEHEQAQKCDPFNPVLTSFLAVMYSYAGRYEDAVKYARKSFEIIPDFPVGHFALGETYMAMGKYAEAVESYKKLVDIAPEWSWILGYA
ncbi:MAG: helix-turn-helix domain-containing protein, partial [Draconibacterium sp.]|nr:helix-turn-helix domain-containing protein [Draconibacterium sp.]